LRIWLYNRVWRMTSQKGGDVHLESHRVALHHHTATLNRLDKVLGALRDKTEAGLVGVEFQNATESLLSDRGKVVGIIEENPGDGPRDGTHATDKIGESLSNSGDPAIIGGGEAEGHYRLVSRICDPLGLQLLRNPCIGQHGLANTGGAPEDQVRWVLQTRSQKANGVVLAEDGFHCYFMMLKGLDRFRWSVSNWIW
jgi:hypothetical protein